MAPHKTYLSKEKHEELKKELDFLKGDGRKKIAEQLKVAKSFGDLSENAEYHEARNEQGKMESRIIQLEELLKDVEIVKHHKSDVVEVGTSVTVLKDKETKTFEIVGSEEADMASGKISLGSPLGKSMMGKKKGEEFEFEAPSGKKFTYKVQKID